MTGHWRILSYVHKNLFLCVENPERTTEGQIYPAILLPSVCHPFAIRLLAFQLRKVYRVCRKEKFKKYNWPFKCNNSYLVICLQSLKDNNTRGRMEIVITSFKETAYSKTLKTYFKFLLTWGCFLLCQLGPVCCILWLFMFSVSLKGLWWWCMVKMNKKHSFISRAISCHINRYLGRIYESDWESVTDIYGLGAVISFDNTIKSNLKSFFL